MISFVVWKWAQPGSSRVFLSEHVNVLRAMIQRHYRGSWRMVCVTDDPEGLDPRIHVVPMPVKFEELQNPHGPRFPNCYRRLWNFSREAKDILGERIFSIDIDVIISGDLTPLVERDEPFVGWHDRRRFGMGNKIAGGVYLLQAGAHPQVWEEFDPATSPKIALDAGYSGSDQGWMSYKLFPPKAFWEEKDGLVKIKWMGPVTKPPPHIRIISTGGHVPPWDPVEQERYPWIKDFWTL
jgi:hypothetical protein